MPEKRWHFVAVAAPEVFIASAIADLGYIGVMFAYAYEHATGVVERRGSKLPLALGTRVARRPADPSSFAFGAMRSASDARSLRIRARALSVDLRIEAVARGTRPG